MPKVKDDNFKNVEILETYNVSPLYHGDIVVLPRRDWEVVVNSLRACGIKVNENNISISLPTGGDNAKVS